MKDLFLSLLTSRNFLGRLLLSSQFRFQVSCLLLLLASHLLNVRRVILSVLFLIHCHYDFVVIKISLLCFGILLTNNGLQLLQSLVDGPWTQFRDIWFIEQEPLSVFAFEYFKVFIKVALKRFKLSLGSNLLLDIIGRINQVISNLLANDLGRRLSVFVKDLLNALGFRKARPNHDLELVHMKKLYRHSQSIQNLPMKTSRGN